MEDLQLTDSEKRRFSDLVSELAGMEKTMRNALRTVESQSANKNTATEGGGNDAKYSLADIVDQNGKDYGIGVYLDSTLLDNLSPAERRTMVKEYVKELGGEILTAYDPNGNEVSITIAEPGKSLQIITECEFLLQRTSQISLRMA